MNAAQVFAEPLKDTLSQHREPGYFSVLLSLIFVICLIYATGIIYNKLSNLGLKTLKKQNGDFVKNKITILSTTPLGSNKTLHVIELDGRKMLIGASANSIHLIKDLSENCNYTVSGESKAVNPEIMDGALQEDTSEKIEHTDLDEEFGLYRKYLR